MDLEVKRIAMWSGPRNVSTALMRSWGNRPDTHVWDEPFYAYYLTRRDVAHPGRDEVVREHETDWRRVVERLTGPIPDGKIVFYQKQMAHHLLPEIDRGWLDRVTHCFLIRDPREMLTSLVKQLPEPTLADTGLPQQLEIFEAVREKTGRVPPVVDSRDLLEDPGRMLKLLCRAVEIEFATEMLAWPPGPRRTDGVWAKHWYESVERSTGFKPYAPKPDPLPPELGGLHGQCVEHYEKLHRRRLGAAEG